MVVKPSILLVVLVLAGCGKKEERPAAAPPPLPPAPADAPSADAAPVRGGPDDPLAEKLRHCPVTVDGARTAIAEVEGGVGFTITAPDDTAAAEIRRRAAHLAALTAGTADRAAHGGGEGGGAMRNCPVVVTDTRVTAEDIPGGSQLVVRPTPPLGVADLRLETLRRHAALDAP